MKLLIAVDMEGISGVTSWEHVTPSDPEYQRMRHIMTADVNAAVAGAASAGVEEIIVADGHWDGRNLLIEELDPRARLNISNAAPFSMVRGVDSGVDAAFFIGYHARAGSLHGILDHTWSSTSVLNLWLNGRLCGETGLNASMCGHFNVPVLMVSGDQTLAAEAREWIAGVETVIVKRAGSRYSAECLHPSVSQELIRAAASHAIEQFKAGQAPKPLQTAKPITVGVEFANSAMGDGASLLPGSVRVDGRKVEYTCDDMVTAYNAFRSLVRLTG